MVPSSGSVACPEKLMVIAHLPGERGGGGVDHRTGGAVVEPTTMLMGSLSSRPPAWSVTRRRVTIVPVVL